MMTEHQKVMLLALDSAGGKNVPVARLRDFVGSQRSFLPTACAAYLRHLSALGLVEIGWAFVERKQGRRPERTRGYSLTPAGKREARRLNGEAHDRCTQAADADRDR